MRHVVLWGSGIAVMLLAPLLILLGTEDLQSGDPVLVVSSPWGAEAVDVINRTGLHEISPERAPFGALTEIVAPEDVQRLKQNGALFVIGGSKVAQLCAD